MKLDLLTGQFKEEAKKKNKSPEASVKSAIISYLKHQNGYVREINSGGVLSGGKWRTSGQGSGIADILCWLPFTRFIAVEVKAPGKKRTATDEQHKFLREVISRGFIACIADSLDCVKLAMEQTREQRLETLDSFKRKPRALKNNAPLFP